MLNPRAIWLLLFLLSVLGSTPAHAFFSVQNRVGDFFSQGRDPAGLNYPSGRTGIGENQHYHYEPASGNPEARYYNPLIRRFINTDPARDAWNWFAYAGGNPISFVDPTGFAANLANNSSGGIGSGLLDLGQTGIGLLGLVPAYGNFADGINAGISGLRGNYADAAIDGASAIPGSGQIAGGAAIINRGGRGIGKIVDGVKSLFKSAKKGKVLFGQPNVKSTFANGPFKGKSINEVSQGLRNGTMSPDQLPLDVVVRNGQTVTLNNRSLTTLRRAGLEPTVIRDRTGIQRFENLLDSHLGGTSPSDVIRVRGGPPGTSLIAP